MKKLNLILFCVIALAIVSCKDGREEELGRQTPHSQLYYRSTITRAPTISETLNGVNESTALELIKYFEDSVYKKQKLPKLNFWLGKDVVNDILDVIKDDRNTGIKTDGIRIYFTGNFMGSAGSLLLVTTDSVANGVHKDYYIHGSKNKLFSNPNRFTTIFSKSNKGGSKLYSSGSDDDDGSGCSEDQTIHDLKRSEAVDMVKNFPSGGIFEADSALINTKSVWFPTVVFAALISTKSCDGIRIYYSRGTAKHKDAHHRNRDSFVISSTKKASNPKYHDDFFYCKETLRKFLPLGNAQNNGALCPYSCN